MPNPHGPSLPCSMEMSVIGFTTPDPLPGVEPGALPLLQLLTLQLNYPQQPLRLPRSWGQPGAPPNLRSLKIVGPVALPLPVSWARGFPQLATLMLAGPKPNSSAAAAPPPAAAQGEVPAGQAAHHLPDAWAHFPQLTSLTLSYQGLAGRFPAAWQANGSFPLLRDL